MVRCARCRRVLTTGWLDGEKLSQSKAADVAQLVNLGVICCAPLLHDAPCNPTCVARTRASAELQQLLGHLGRHLLCGLGSSMADALPQPGSDALPVRRPEAAAGHRLLSRARPQLPAAPGSLQPRGWAALQAQPAACLLLGTLGSSACASPARQHLHAQSPGSRAGLQVGQVLGGAKCLSEL